MFMECLPRYWRNKDTGVILNKYSTQKRISRNGTSAYRNSQKIFRSILWYRKRPAHSKADKQMNFNFFRLYSCNFWKKLYLQHNIPATNIKRNEYGFEPPWNPIPKILGSKKITAIQNMPPNFSIVPSNRGSNIINTNAALIYHHAPLRLSVSKSLEIPSISANTANPLS